MTMQRAVRWLVVGILCSACVFAVIPAGAADDPQPTPLEELDKLPVGLKVTHDPQPSRATKTGNRGRLGEYTWFFKTTVRAPDGDVKLTEFGAYWQSGRTWVFNTITGKPFTPKDFADWYSCPGAALRKGKDYTDPNNCVTGGAVQASKSRWYYIGVDGSGRRVKGEAVSEEKGEIDPKRPTDSVGQLPLGLGPVCELARAR
jgi:hypothetical protein